MTALRTAVVGEEALTVECVRVLLDRGHEVAAVASPSAAIRDWAGGEGLLAVETGPGLADRLGGLDLDLLFSVANLQMLPDEVLALPKRMPVNFHDGPLPRHAGLFATSWAILEGDERHGITWHVMTAEADTGDVLLARTVPVEPGDTVHDLDVRCFAAGVASFAELVDGLAAGTVTPVPQDLSQRTYHGRLDGPPRAGLLDWSRPAAELVATVRATAFRRRANEFGSALLWTGRDLAVVTGATESAASTAPPGTVVSATADALVVATTTRDVALTGLLDPDGGPAAGTVPAGTVLPEPSPDDVAALERAAREGGRRERRWRRALTSADPLGAPRLGVLPAPVAPPAAAPAPRHALGAVLALLVRLGGAPGTVAVPTVRAGGPAGALMAAEVPLLAPDGLLDRTWDELPAVVDDLTAEVAGTAPFRRDVRVRDPQLAGVPHVLPVAVVPPGREPTGSDRPLTVVVDGDGTVTFRTGAGAAAATTASWLAERYALFTAAARADPDRPLGDVPLLTDTERELVLHRWNDTADGYPARRCVTALVARSAARRPDAPAVRCGADVLTYRELDLAARRVAARLRALGAGHGGVVGVALTRSVDLVVALLGVLRSGAAYVPVDPVYPPARIEHMLTDSGVELLLTDAGAPGAAWPSGVTAVPVERGAGGPEPDPVDHARPDDPAYVIYTSGSTGQPKGVQVGHRALTNFLTAMGDHPGFGPGDTLAALTTVCFDIAGLELYLPLVRGGTVDVVPADVAGDGFALRALLDERGPDVVQATPATWRMLVAAGWAGDPRLRVLCGGEALAPDLADQLVARAGEVHNLYGPTETTIWSAVDRVGAGEPVTIGRPIANTRLRVLDGRDGLVPPGVPGELYIAGDGVADGYLGRPELTAERFRPDPWGPGRMYRTGDLVRHRPDGRLEYLERTDGQVKLHGYRIELGEVESALRRVPGVTGAAAVVREDRPGDRTLVGYVTGAGAPPPSALRDRLRTDLPGYMVPSAVVVLTRLPTTPNGKLDRRALPRPVPSGAGTAAAPSGGTELRVAAAWCAVLGLEEVGADDNFFDVGGDSLRLTSVVAALRADLGATVTRVDMFAHPTVRSMARHLTSDVPEEPAPARRGRDVGALAGRRGRRGRP